MAMWLSSCTTTLLSRAPAPAPGKSSPAAVAALPQLRSRQPPAAAASVAALRWASRKEPRSRAALFTCHVYVYDIQPSALVNPRENNDGDWRLKDENDQISLRFNVGDTSEGNLEVATTEDQALLVIRYKKNATATAVVDKQSPASSLDVRLLMPPGYDSDKMQAYMLSSGWLQIIIPKPKHQPKTITISPPPPPPPLQPA